MDHNISINSAIHKAAGLTVPNHSMIWLVLFHHSTIPSLKPSMREQSVGVVPASGFFWEQLVTKEPAALWIALLDVHSDPLHIHESIVSGCELATWSSTMFFHFNNPRYLIFNVIIIFLVYKQNVENNDKKICCF